MVLTVGWPWCGAARCAPRRSGPQAPPATPACPTPPGSSRSHPARSAARTRGVVKAAGAWRQGSGGAVAAASRGVKTVVRGCVWWCVKSRRGVKTVRAWWQGGGGAAPRRLFEPLLGSPHYLAQRDSARSRPGIRERDLSVKVHAGELRNVEEDLLTGGADDAREMRGDGHKGQLPHRHVVQHHLVSRIVLRHATRGPCVKHGAGAKPCCAARCSARLAGGLGVGLGLGLGLGFGV